MIRAFSAALALTALALTALALTALAAPQAPAQTPLADEQGERFVVLRGVDKIVGRPATIEASTQTPATFGQLTIHARACEKAPPTERPEVKAFLQITEATGEPGGTRIFSGWMFASSPSLNALEHPVYDLWVTDCKMVAGSASEDSR